MIFEFCENSGKTHWHPLITFMDMTDELTQAAMTTWAAKDLPARLLAAQVAKLLNCTPEDVARARHCRAHCAAIGQAEYETRLSFS